MEGFNKNNRSNSNIIILSDEKQYLVWMEQTRMAMKDMEVKIPMLAKILHSINVYDLIFYKKDEDLHRNCLLDINKEDRPVTITVYDAQIQIARQRANIKTCKLIKESVSFTHQNGIMGKQNASEVFLYFQECYNHVQK
eukprot:Pgem_evm1s13641